MSAHKSCLADVSAVSLVRIRSCPLCLWVRASLIQPVAHEKAGRVIQCAVVPGAIVPDWAAADIRERARLAGRDRPEDLIMVPVSSQATHVPVFQADGLVADILQRHHLGELVH